MLILGIESSSLVASVALIRDDILLAEYTINYKKTHSQTLMPMFDEIIKMTDIDLSEIDAIAVSGGPGSFTGLRIGAATAKGLALALDRPMIAVPTLEAMAYNFYKTDYIICPIMDARRNQVYTGLYSYKDEFKVLKEQRAMDIDELIDELNDCGEGVIFLGDGLVPCKNSLIQRLKVKYEFAPAHINRQRASSLAGLGMEYYKSGRFFSSYEFELEYLRKSQAERELEKKGL